ncbi:MULTISPECIES: thiamine pyrophosphate-binding protein [Streptomyces]|uniref:thiamine pyrophosphate-binding protein n=1 Tax=Streptomyces TaxID=1883 RepID=UPI00067C94A7|nr:MULTISPECIES: thiamine pyrophosphate-binding protein [unclassified Streptomyces]
MTDAQTLTAERPAAAPGRRSAAELLVQAFVDRGFTHFTGVPCSLLKGVFRVLESGEGPAEGVSYLPAPREDSALGVASGLSAAGAKPVVLMQNSGLGYSLNVLTSLNLIYDLHVPLIVSWRGHDGNDAVEHDIIGRELLNLLDVFGLRHTVFDATDPYASVERCLAASEDGLSTPVLIVKEGI